MMPGDHGEVLRYRISHTLHANSPHVTWLPWLNKEKSVYSITDEPDDAIEWFAWGLGQTYEYICGAARDLYPSFWTGVALFGLTLVSLLFRRTVRATIRKKGIRLADPALAGHVRSVGHEEPATMLEAAD
jgi:hypothetical protein